MRDVFAWSAFVRITLKASYLFGRVLVWQTREVVAESEEEARAFLREMK